MSDAMNEIAKALASDMPRRKVFKLALGGAAASISTAVAGVVKPLIALANPFISTSVQVNDASGPYGGTVDLSAILVNGQSLQPLNGQPLSFWLNQSGGYSYEGTASTSNQGAASIPGVSLAGINADTYYNGLFVNYAGDDTYFPSMNYGNLTVYAADTEVIVNTATGVYGGSVDLSAQLQSLVDGALPPADQLLDFSLFTTEEGTAPTDIYGVATMSDVSLQGIDAGTYVSGIFVQFTGNNNYNWSSNYGTLIVNQAPTSLTVNPVNGLPGGRANLEARLTAYINASYQPLVNHDIQFFLLNHHVGFNRTNVEGIADLMNVSLSGIAPGVYPNGVEAGYDNNDEGNYQSAYATNTLTIATPHTVVPLYNENAGFRRPYWALIRLYVANEQGQNVSSRTLKVTSVELTRAGGSSIPFAYRFSFDSQLVRGGGYQLLINTRYLELGTYTLTIHVDDDPTPYSVQFVLY